MVNKIFVVFLIFIFTTTALAQNKFREGSEIVIKESSLKDAFYKCIEKIGKPTVNETADNLVLSYSFTTPDGKIIFGKDNITKKIEAVIIFIYSDAESDWLIDYVELNSYIENDSLYIKNNNLKCQEYLGGNQKVMMIAFGDIEFSGKMEFTL